MRLVIAGGGTGGHVSPALATIEALRRRAPLDLLWIGTSDGVECRAATERGIPFRAIQAGKLPRKAGLIVVRHGAQYELTLQAETLAVSGAALPKIEGASGHDLKVARVDALRHLVETLDLLYDAYGRRRVGPDWSGELGRIRRWLHQAA